MTLNEMIAEVYTVTKRPDLVSDTLTALRASTLKMHHVDYFYKDILQSVVTLAAADYVGVFDTSLLTKYRSMKFIRKWYPTGTNIQTLLATGKAGLRMARADVDAVIDGYGRDRVNVYYVAGTSVNLKSSDVLGTYLVGWYSSPDINVATYRSFIAEEHPYAIVFDAAATVFKTIGYDEQTALYKQMVAEQIAMLKMTNIEEEGR